MKGVHREKLKKLMVHSSQTLQPSSIRILLTIEGAHQFEVWISGVGQASLQSSDSLYRDLCLRDLLPQFELDSHEALQLLRPLYGLCESGDMWYKTLDDHHGLDLKMKPLGADASIYFLSLIHI